MWAGSGVSNPQNIGKPPAHGGFQVQSLIPPNLLPGAGQAGGQGVSAPAPGSATPPPAPPPGGMQSPFAAIPSAGKGIMRGGVR